jgi:nitrogen-specific signal transduction histidine kinase
MKSRFIILFFVFTITGALAFLTVKIANRNIEETYKNDYRTTFQLLSVIADDYLESEKELNKIEINNLKEKGYNILKRQLKDPAAPLDVDIDGTWIFGDSLIKAMTRYSELEDIILDFYNRELNGRIYGALLNIENNPFYLVNISENGYNVLLLSKKGYGRASGIAKVLDSLVVSSNLLYFSILDENNSPVVYSSLYEGFLPIEGEGSHIIATPRGNVFQIEERRDSNSIVAGFSMKSLEKITVTNRFLLILAVSVFAVLTGFLLYNFTKFENFRMDKEREIRHLEEIGALSSGFSHELRNSLNTLSLLSRNTEGEQGEILKEEVKRMNVIMDSIKLLILSEIDKKTVDIDNTIAEAISLVDNRNNSVQIKLETTSKLKIQGNRPLLISAFSNIMKNAVEADANKITIMIRKAGNIMRILFIDNGKGIEREKVNRVFEPFYSDKKQSGLGLYLARKIIEAHGGSIRLESWKETRVDILLPLKK